MYMYMYRRCSGGNSSTIFLSSNVLACGNNAGWAMTLPTSLRVHRLAFTRYSFTSRLLCTNQPSFHSPRPPALPTLMQYYCATIGQYMTPPSNIPFVYHAPYNIGHNNIMYRPSHRSVHINPHGPSSSHTHSNQKTRGSFLIINKTGSVFISTGDQRPYVLNTRKAENNSVLYSCLACFMNTVTLNMYTCMSHTGLHRRNTLLVFLWLRHRNT